MTTSYEYSLLSANVYGNNRTERSLINTVTTDAGWTNITRPAMRSSLSGFMASAFVKGNELVISYAGTTDLNLDWLSGNIPAAVGKSAYQVFEAAKFYLDTLASPEVQGKNLSVSFTGHSLGGGLASLMAVFFSKPAVVFDEAPFLSSAINPEVPTNLKNDLLASGVASLPPEFLAYSWAGQNPADTYEVRKKVVLQHYLDGEFLSIAGQLSKIQGGSAAYYIDNGGFAGEKPGPLQMHSINLLSSLIASPTFDMAMSASPELVARYFNNEFSSTNIDLASNSLALDVALLNATVAKTPVTYRQWYTPNSVLQAIGEEVLLLTNSMALKAAPGAGRYVIAGISDYLLSAYYKQITANAPVLNNPLAWDQYNANLSVTLSTANFDTQYTRQSFEKFLKSYFPKLTNVSFQGYDRWSFQIGTLGLNTSAFTWTNSNDSLYDAAIGGATVDNLSTGAGNDLLMGGKGDDFLQGGTGDDKYYYAVGDGFDTITEAGGNDSIVVYGALSTSLVKSKKGNSLVLSFGGSQLLIENYYSNSSYQIESFTFDDRTLTAADLASLPSLDIPVPESVAFSGTTLKSFNVQNETVSNQLYAYGNGFGYGSYTEYMAYYSSQGFTLDASTTLSGRSLTVHFGNDYVIGSAFNDVVYSFGGNDFINSGAGNDTVSLSGTGTSTVRAGAGDDFVNITSTTSGTVYLEEGDDVFNGGTSYSGSTVYGGDGSDALTGGYAADNLDGGLGSDVLTGGAGDDVLTGGGGGIDYSDGGAGNDTYRYKANDGKLTIIDSAGTDTLDLSSIVSSAVKFLDNTAEVGSLRGFAIESDTVHVLINYTTIIESIKFTDKTLSYADYTTLMRNRQFSEYDDYYGAGILGPYKLFGMGGNDILHGGMFDDVLNGGSGNDTLRGRDGNDELWGGLSSSFDMLYGENGNDRLYAQAGYTQAYGGDGNDVLVMLNGQGEFQGGAGADQLWGGAFQDNLSGGDGNDYIFGGDGNDSMSGEAGDDTLVKYFGTGTLTGGDGNDQLWGGTGSETLRGDAGNDYLNANVGDNILEGGAGNDALITLGGADTLSGGTGGDTLWAGAGNDTLNGDGDLVTYTDAQGKLRYLTNIVQVDYMYGEAGDDVLTGGIGRNLLVGGDGNDVLLAGGVSQSSGPYQLIARGDVDVSDFLWGGADNDTLSANGGDYLYGEAGNDSLWGQKGANTLDGGAGDDDLHGGDTASNLFGGTGNDKLIAGIAADKLYGGADDDYLEANGADTLYGDAGNDLLNSISGSNTLIAGAGNDYLRSVSTGTDHLWGGAGLDVYELAGSGKYIVHEDSSGGTVDLTAQFYNNILVVGKLLTTDQLYLKFQSGTEVTIAGWGTGAVNIKVDQMTYTSTEVMAVLPSLINKPF